MTYEDFKLFPMSFSKINLYRTCPNQFRAKYFDKEVEFKPTAATTWGTELHSEAEHCIKDNREPTERFEVIKPYLASIRKFESKFVTAEQEFAITKELTPTGFWDDNAWLRGKLDVFVHQEDKAQILDWKSGKAKPKDFEELRCFSLLTFCNHMEIQKTKNTYIWLKQDSKPTTEIIERYRMPELADKLNNTIEQIENSACFDTWQQRQSGLCREYCDVVSCPKNGRNK